MTNIRDILSKIEEVKNDILNLETQADYKNGIACHNCGSFNNTVVDSRENKHGFRIRSRKCIDCSNYWKTIEIVCTQKPKDFRVTDMSEEEVKHWFEFEIAQSERNMKEEYNTMFNGVEVGHEKQIELNKAHIRFCKSAIMALCWRDK